jgi:regulator of nucleoside diphosphate kinase
MKKRKCITISDYQRLIGLIEFASLKAKMPDVINHFYHELMAARMVKPENISEHVVTMNSAVFLKGLSNGREIEITVTYPDDSDNRERKVSVFSSIGMALLGSEVGDTVSWNVPTGTGQFRIIKITYQPEAVGHYYL